MRGWSLLLLGSVVLGAVAPSFAQTETNQQTQLEEVVVTAQRRSESLQKVPISVDAITGTQLQTMGASSSEDLSLIPSIVFNEGLGGGQINIRGIGGTNSGADPGNAVYVDGVYQFAPQANLFEFNGIQRIEVLKGPQGTLFGRNSVGGLVQVITRDPTPQKAGAEMSVGYANYDTTSGSLYLNAPLTDTLAFNVAAFGFDQREGWGHNFATGSPVHLGYAVGGHFKLKWEAADGKTDVVISGLFDEDKPVSSVLDALAPGTRNILGQPTPGLYNANTNVDPYRRDKQYTESVTIHHDFGAARLTSITAYDTVCCAVAVADADGSPAPLLAVELSENFYTFSQEVHLQSEEGSRLQWIVGGLFLHDVNTETTTFSESLATLLFGSSPAMTHSTVTTRSYAAFGQATYAFTHGTRITAGLRHTQDDASRIGGPPPVRQTSSNSRPTWRLAVDHDFTKDVMGYVSYSRGFKSGLFNPSDPSHPAVAPETLDAYEVGLKTETFGHRLRVNAAGFYYNFKGVQVQVFDPVLHVAYFTNAGNARPYGLDLDVAAEPIEGLTLTGGLSLADAKFTAGISNCFTVPPSAGGAIEGLCPLNGRQLPYAPRFVPAVGVSYERPTQIGRFVLSATDTHNSGFFNDPSNFEPARTRPYNMLNASVTWTSRSDHLNASLWAKNLLNEHIIAGGEVGALVGNATGVYPMAPLTFGGTIAVKL
jgi:iron complex outermembrane receptor protein